MVDKNGVPEFDNLNPYNLYVSKGNVDTYGMIKSIMMNEYKMVRQSPEYKKYKENLG